MSVGVMKDYKLKQRNLRASHTLCFTIFFFLGNSLREYTKYVTVTSVLSWLSPFLIKLYKIGPALAATGRYSIHLTLNRKLHV
jgi:hypothetical protein